jgi:hypothetical protein
MSVIDKLKETAVDPAPLPAPDGVINGIDVRPSAPGVILTLILDSKASGWVHFSPEQARGLIDNIEKWLR